METYEEFKTGAYADRMEDVNTADQALADLPDGDDDAALLEASELAQKKFERAESELQQLSQEAARAAY